MDERRLAQETQSDLAAIQSREQIAAMNADVKERTNTADNNTALTLAEMEVLSGERIGLSTGTGINP